MRSDAALPPPGALVASVITDVAGLNKEFDYLVPPDLAASVQVGTTVRVQLHGRRVGGWVTSLDDAAVPERALLPIAKVRGWGPTADLIDLASWAAWRWYGRSSWFLKVASPASATARLPAPALRPPAAPEGVSVPSEPGAVVLRLPPAFDVTRVVAAAAQLGPVLVVLPSVARASVLASRLRRAGGDVAVVPDQWRQARAGAAVVVGARGAAWAPCPAMSAVVVVDAHDSTLVAEGAPTWGAAEVAVERARRAGVPCLLTSPCPTVELLAIAGSVTVSDPSVERAGWAALEVIDRRVEDPRHGLYGSRVVSAVRQAERAVCVLNRTGRVRLLACAACGELARCERCGAAVRSEDAAGVQLMCPSCGMERPRVCAACGSTVMRQLRVGVSRAREELEALLGRPVGEVTAASDELPATPVLVGTEAVLRRVPPGSGVAVVAFLDFDQELLAPRMRAGSESLGMLALASRLVGGRATGGRVIVQTRVPDHPVIRSALLGDPSVTSDADLEVRRALALPPFSSVAMVSGPGGAEFAGGLATHEDLEVLGPHDEEWMIKAATPAVLANTLADIERPAERLRVAVDPSRM